MKRYTTLLIVAFVFVTLSAIGTVYLSGYAGNASQKPDRSLLVYTTLPPEHVAILAAEYEKQHRVQIKFEPLSADNLLERLNKEKDKPVADMVLADREVLEKAAKKEVFAEYISESSDMVADVFCGADNSWTGVWYDPVVFCINSDYLKTLRRYPMSWADLPEYQSMRIGITDFLAADASANLLCFLVKNNGQANTFALLNRIHPQIVQYAKYLSTPVRMAGMNEVDLAIAVQSETMRYISDGYPLKIIYPSEGTAYCLTGAGVLQDGEAGDPARAFADWLLSDEAQLALQKHKFYFISTNPATMAYKMFGGKNIALFDDVPDFTEQKKHELLDGWVKNVRLK